MHGLPVKHVSHFAQQRTNRKWFLQQFGAACENATLRDKVMRVTGHVEHFHIRPHLCQLVGQVAPADAGREMASSSGSE